MKIFKNNASALLFEKINSLRQSYESWRCIHLRFSDYASSGKTSHAQFAVNAINEKLCDEEGFAYVCRDGDIFILFQGRAQPILRKLSSEYLDLDENDGDNSLVSLYDLAMEWPFFFALCYRKSLSDQSWEAPLPFGKARAMGSAAYENI